MVWSRSSTSLLPVWTFSCPSVCWKAVFPIEKWHRCQKPTAHKYGGSESRFRHDELEVTVLYHFGTKLHERETTSSTQSPGISRVSSVTAWWRTTHCAVHRNAAAPPVGSDTRERTTLPPCPHEGPAASLASDALLSLLCLIHSVAYSSTGTTAQIQEIIFLLPRKGSVYQ